MDRGLKQNKMPTVYHDEQPRKEQWDLSATEHCRDAFTILGFNKNNTLISRTNT